MFHCVCNFEMLISEYQEEHGGHQLYPGEVDSSEPGVDNVSTTDVSYGAYQHDENYQVLSISFYGYSQNTVYFAKGICRHMSCLYICQTLLFKTFESVL